MVEKYIRLKAAVEHGEPLPNDVGEWVLVQLAESKAVLAERDRLIGFHADRLSNGKLYRGCQHLLVYLVAEHESLQDLIGLNCPIPQIRQLYNIAKANLPPRKVRGQNARDYSHEGDRRGQQDDCRGAGDRSTKPLVLDSFWIPIVEDEPL